MLQVVSKKQQQQPIQLNCESLPQEVSINLLHIIHNTVHISTLKWRQLCMDKYVKNIVKWQVADRLNISNNKEPQILISISHIAFPSLKVLNLEHNLIVSIQVLNTILMPNLQQFNLTNNYITHTQNLRKCNWSNLQKISLSGNRIVEVKGLSQMKSNNLREIIIEHDNVNKVQGYDPRWFFKIQPFGIFEVFNIKSVNRIKINKFKQKVSQKYPYIFP